MNEATRMRLMAYHDGECGRLESAWLRWRVSRSPALARELEALAELSGWVRDAGGSDDAPRDSLWSSISLALASTGVRRTGARSDAREARTVPFAWGRLWRPAGAAVAGLAVVGLWLALSGPPGVAPIAEPAVSGSLRYLDTFGRPVMVFDDAEDITIIWLMNGPESEGT